MNSVARSDRLHITIGVHPPNTVSLSQEIKLIKAALLYADKVTIYSPTASILQIVMRVSDLSDNQRLLFLEMVAPYVASSTRTAARISDSLRKLRDPSFSYSLQGKILKSSLLNQSESAWSEIRQIIDNVAETAGMGELVTVLDSGILEIHQFANQTSPSRSMQYAVDCIAQASGKQLSKRVRSAIDLRTNEMTKEFVDGVCNAVASGSTYPLFDKDTGELVSLAQKEGYANVTGAAQQRARHIALAGDMLQRLPVFDNASTSDILLVRAELEKYLVRFRKSVIDFASSIGSGPWDDDFAKECELIFRRDISPTILELDEAIKSNKFLGQLARKALDRPLVFTPGATLSLVLSQLTNLPKEIVASLGIGIGVATLVYDVYREWSEKQRVIDRNGLYFYYQAGKKLEKLQ